jgi:hypothetical protein
MRQLLMEWNGTNSAMWKNGDIQTIPTIYREQMLD